MSQSADSASYLRLSVAGCEVTCKMQQIEEILSPRPCRAIAGTQPWFLGLATYQGEFLAVSDLSGFVASQSQRAHSSTQYKRDKWLIVRRARERLALVVDDVQECTEDAAMQMATSDAECLAAFSGAVRAEAADLVLLDLEALINTPAFLDIAQPDSIIQPDREQVL